MVDKAKTIFEPLSEQERIDIITQILAKYDVMHWLMEEEPLPGNKKYGHAAELIETAIAQKRGYFGFPSIIQRVFESQFNKKIGINICGKIGHEIIVELSIHIDFYMFLADEHLKGKVQLVDSEYRLTVHPGFEIASFCGNTYINGKFYYDIEDQDLLQEYIDFVGRSDRVFVQYKHRHLLWNNAWEHPRGYFKEIKQTKFEWFKLKHREDIESIFDNQRVIYSPSMNDNQIIDSMRHQGITRVDEKVLFSPDRKHRLIIYKNESGSFSFHEERLTINAPQERVMYGTIAYWEQTDRMASFYESLDNLLRELKVDFKDWKSDAE